jgi:endoglucanase
MTPEKQRSSQSPVIGEEQIRLLEKLSNAVAISGDEGAVRKIVLEEVSPYADELRVDALGNVLVTCKAAVENPLRVMLAAHMDEIGFMLVHKEDDGLYQFSLVGGIDVRSLPASRYGWANNVCRA